MRITFETYPILAEKNKAILMAVHHGGKVGGVAKTLASKGSSKPAKSKAEKTLANHKAKSH